MTFDLAAAHAAVDQLGVEHAADVVAAVQAATDPLLAELAAAQATIADLRQQLRGTQWGSSVERRRKASGLLETAMEALARLQSTFGPIDRYRYYGPDGALPAWPIVTANPNVTQLTEAAMAGIELDISFKPQLGDVIAGRADAAIDLFCAAADDWFKRTGQKTRVAMWHEADVKIRKGTFTLAQYRAAADHFNARVKAFGSPGIETAFCFTKFTLVPGNGLTFADLLPVDVDVFCWDVYATTAATTVPSMLDPIRANAIQYGKPWAIWECGVDGATHTPAQRNAKLTELAASCKSGTPAADAVDYFNSDPGGTPPKWSIDDDAAAVAALKAGQAR